MRGCLCFALALITACSPDVDTRDGGEDGDGGSADITDASTSVDGGDDAGTSPPIDAGEPFPACPPVLPSSADCESPVVGDGPFGVVLEGTAPFVVQEDVVGFCFIHTYESARVTTYFPEGRGEGRAVVFATDALGEGLGVADGTLDSGAGVTDVELRSWPNEEETRIDGSLVGPSDGLVAIVERKFQAGFDGPEWASAEMRLCPTGEAVPEPLLSRPFFDDNPLGPLAYFRLRSTVPVRGQGELVAVRNAVTQAIVPAVVSLGDFIEVHPIEPLTPGTALVLESSGQDVIGRSLALVDAEVATLATTSTVADETFAAQPPSGSLAGDVRWCSNGRLALGGTCVWNGSFGNEAVVSSLVAFDVPSGATHVSALLQRPRCTGVTTKVAWLRGTERAELSVACNSAWLDLESAIPSGEGPLYLAYFFDPGPPPLWSEAPPYDIGEMLVDEVAFLDGNDAGG